MPSLKSDAHWFEQLKSYCEPGGTLAIENQQIRSAKKFEGWRSDYLNWPVEHWEDYANGVPSHDEAKNAFHIQYLAMEIERRNAWIGRELETRPCGSLMEGHHRLRAVKYLLQEKSIVVPPPACIIVFLPHPSLLRFRANPERFRDIKDLFEKLDMVIGQKQLASWMQTHSALSGGASPLASLENGDIGLVDSILPKYRTDSE